jgi:hypothetical protein
MPDSEEKLEGLVSQSINGVVRTHLKQDELMEPPGRPVIAAYNQDEDDQAAHVVSLRPCL